MDKFRRIFEDNKKLGLYNKMYKSLPKENGRFDIRHIEGLKSATNNFSECLTLSRGSIIPTYSMMIGIEYITSIKLTYNPGSLLIEVALKGDCFKYGRGIVHKTINLKNVTNEDLDDIVKILSVYDIYRSVAYSKDIKESDIYHFNILLTIFPDLQVVVSNYRKSIIDSNYDNAYRYYIESTVVNKSTVEFLAASVCKFYNTLSVKGTSYMDVKTIINSIKKLEFEKSNTPINDSKLLLVNEVSIDCSILDANCIHKIIAVLHS